MYCTRGDSLGPITGRKIPPTILTLLANLGATSKTPKTLRRQRVQYHEAEKEQFGVLYVERIGSQRDERYHCQG
jgi:hypothetical protein